MTDKEDLDVYNQIPTLFASDDQYQQDTTDEKQTSYASELEKEPQDEPKTVPKEAPKKESKPKRKSSPKRKAKSKKSILRKKKNEEPQEEAQEPAPEEISSEEAPDTEETAEEPSEPAPEASEGTDETIQPEEPAQEASEGTEEAESDSDIDENDEEPSEDVSDPVEEVEMIGPAPKPSENELPLCGLCGMPVHKGEEGVPIDGVPTHKTCVDELMESEIDEPQIIEPSEGPEEEDDLDLTSEEFEDEQFEEIDDDSEGSPEDEDEEEGSEGVQEEEGPAEKDNESEDEATHESAHDPEPIQTKPVCASCGKEIDTDAEGCLILIKNTPFCRECVENNLDMRIAVAPPKLETEEVQDEQQEEEEQAEEQKGLKGRFNKLKNKANKGTDRLIEGKPKKKKKSKDDNVDPDAFMERLRRWYLITFKNYVRLRTLSRNNRTGEFIQETTLIKKKDLPHDAVQCTGERGFYCLDLIKDSDWYIRNHYKNMGLREYQFTASDAWLYMQSNKIDNALMVNWTERASVDLTKIIMIVAVACVIGLIVVMRM